MGICGARFFNCVCSRPAGCDGTNHMCDGDGCQGQWTYDHEGIPVPVVTPLGERVPDDVLIWALRYRDDLKVW